MMENQLRMAKPGPDRDLDIEPGLVLPLTPRRLRTRPTEPKTPVRWTTASLLLTDIVGSCGIWEREPEAMEDAIASHDGAVARVVERFRGRLIKARGEGDSSFTIFQSATAAVHAAVELQQQLSEVVWSTTEPIRVRVAVSTGDIVDRAGELLGLEISRAARIRALARGGEILLGAATAAMVADSVPVGTELISLGERELRGLRRPERVFELRGAGTSAGHPA
jgi:class 3 adenylate cyclase